MICGNSAKPFLAQLRAGEPSLGVWLNLRGIAATEITAQAGYDWVLLDQEHSPRSIEELGYTLGVLRGFAQHAIVRAPSGDAHTLSQLLDAGVTTLMVPMLETREQAEHFVRSCSFPPAGIRGVSGQTRGGNWGSNPDYVHHARASLCLIAQIESALGCANVREILNTDGIDAVFVGPADLAATMGHPGNPHHPEVQAAIARVVRIATELGVPCGTLAKGHQAGLAAFAQGYSFVGVGTDTAMLREAHAALTSPFLKIKDSEHEH